MIVTVDYSLKGTFRPPAEVRAIFDGDGAPIRERLFWVDTETGEAVAYPDGPIESTVDDCGRSVLRREWRQFKPPIRIIPLEDWR